MKIFKNIQNTVLFHCNLR